MSANARCSQYSPVKINLSALNFTTEGNHEQRVLTESTWEVIMQKSPLVNGHPKNELTKKATCGVASLVRQVPSEVCTVTPEKQYKTSLHVVHPSNHDEPEQLQACVAGHLAQNISPRQYEGRNLLACRELGESDWYN